MGGRDHSIECDVCGKSYGGMNAVPQPNCARCDGLGWYWDPNTDPPTDQRYSCTCDQEHECDPASAEQFRLAQERIASWTPEFIHALANGDDGCDDERCFQCRGGAESLATLAANLATAAALCAAFRQGEYFERDTAIGGWRLELRWAPWLRPSCAWMEERVSDRDTWIARPQPTPEMCRLIHGIDCRLCLDHFTNGLDRLAEKIGAHQRDSKWRKR